MFDACDRKLHDDEAEWVGHFPGTPLTDLPADALRLLAARYFDERISLDYHIKYYGVVCGWRMIGFIGVRLNTLALAMGERAFEAISTEKDAEWARICAEADAAERALPPCVTCGRSRKLADEMWQKGTGMCRDCFDKMLQREHPSFAADADGGPPFGEHDDVF